jgi:hypothetical protein
LQRVLCFYDRPGYFVLRTPRVGGRGNRRGGVLERAIDCRVRAINGETGAPASMWDRMLLEKTAFNLEPFDALGTATEMTALTEETALIHLKDRALPPRSTMSGSMPNGRPQ